MGKERPRKGPGAGGPREGAIRQGRETGKCDERHGSTVTETPSLPKLPRAESSNGALALTIWPARPSKVRRSSRLISQPITCRFCFPRHIKTVRRPRQHADDPASPSTTAKAAEETVCAPRRRASSCPSPAAQGRNLRAARQRPTNIGEFEGPTSSVHRTPATSASPPEVLQRASQDLRSLGPTPRDPPARAALVLGPITPTPGTSADIIGRRSWRSSAPTTQPEQAATFAFEHPRVAPVGPRQRRAVEFHLPQGV